MAVTIEPSRDGSGRRFAIVVSRFNDFVTSRLKDGAIEALEECKVLPGDIEVLPVPGAFEIPLAARRAALTGRFSAVICLGAVIRGETPHFEYVAAECARGVANVSVETGVPAIFGVLTTDDAGQAIERSGGKAGHRGRDAAVAALEIVSLLERVERRGSR